MHKVDCRRIKLFILAAIIIIITGCDKEASGYYITDDAGDYEDNSETDTDKYVIPLENDPSEEYFGDHDEKAEKSISVNNDVSVVSEEDPGNNANERDSEGSVDQSGSDEEDRDEDISLIMVGDILLHDSVERNCRLDDGSYDFSGIFRNTRDDISSADIALVNQEVIIGGSELGITGYPSFNAPYEIADELVDTGFDVICHATNHALDRRKAGIINCLNYWRENHPDEAVIGIYDSEEASEDIYIYEKNGIKLAILNYTYGTNGIPLPKDMPYAVKMLDEDVVVRDLRRADELADFVVVCPHWGTEYNLNISTEQDNWTELFLDNGADLVIGTHPHVIEPMEWEEDKEAGNRMLVYYSLGNYVNWTAGNGPGTSNRMIGGLARVNIGRNDSGQVVIKDYGVEALVCHLSKEKGKITVYRLNEYTEELAQSNEIVKQDSNFSKQYCIDLCNDVWGENWE